MQLTAVLFTVVLAFTTRAEVVTKSCGPALEENPEARAFEANRENKAIFRALTLRPPALSIGSWNLDLLKHFVKPITAQDFPERLARMHTVLARYLRTTEAPDVFTLQEFWAPGARLGLDAVAAQAGYEVIDLLDRESARHGLQIWVRKGLASRVVASGFSRYPHSLPFSAFEVAGRVWRGVLWAKLLLPDGQKVLVSTTHLTPFARYATRRRAQIHHLAEILDDLKTDCDHVVLTGDFNIAADYEGDEAEGEVLGKVRELYPLLTWSTKLRDTFRAVRARDEDPGFTYNPKFRRRRVRLRLAAKRLDYILAGETSPGFAHYVSDVNTLFKEKWNDLGQVDDSGLYLSDHFLVRTVIHFFRKPGNEN